MWTSFPGCWLWFCRRMVGGWQSHDTVELVDTVDMCFVNSPFVAPADTNDEGSLVWYRVSGLLLVRLRGA